MSGRLVLTVAVVLVAVALAGCSDSPVDAGAYALLGRSDPAVTPPGGPLARGHFARQQVLEVDPAGNETAATFAASYAVLGNGTARGSFSIFESQLFRVFVITGGRVRCDGDRDIVVLTGTVRELGSEGAIGTFEVEVSEDEDNPECIIWDIKDSCTHDAQGKFDILQSACDR